LKKTNEGECKNHAQNWQNDQPMANWYMPNYWKYAKHTIFYQKEASKEANWCHENQPEYEIEN
jgi:hypothetical protein